MIEEAKSDDFFLNLILISLLLCMGLSDVPNRRRTSFSLVLCSYVS